MFFRRDSGGGVCNELARLPDEVVPAREGGVTIGPRITPVSELYARRGWKPASEEDFERLTADDAPPDDER